MARGIKKKGRRRRWKVAAGICALVVAGGVAAPFIFTDQIVRHYLDASIGGHAVVHFKRATLHIAGGVTLEDVTVNAPLAELRAGRVHIDFSWAQVFSSHFRAVEAEDAVVMIRRAVPVEKAVAGGGSSAPEAAASIAPEHSVTNRVVAALSRLPFEQVLISGRVGLEGFGPFAALFHAGRSMPFRFVVSRGADSSVPTRDLVVVIGDIDSIAALTEPVLAGRAHIRTPRGSRPEVVIDALTASNVSADLLQSQMPSWVTLPLGRDFAARVDQVQISGTLTPGSGEAPAGFDGALMVRDLSAHSSDDRPPMELDRASLSMRISGPLTRRPMSELSFSRAAMSFDLAQWGGWKVSHGSGMLQVGSREIEITDLQASAFDGALTGSGAWDTDIGSVSRASVSIQGANMQRLVSQLGEIFPRLAGVAADASINARLSLLESDGDRMSAHFDVLCPGQLKAGPAATDDAASPAAALPDFLVADNVAVGGIITWTGHRGDPPEISRGKLTADDVSIQTAAFGGPSNAPPLVARNLAAEMTASSGLASIDSITADVGVGAALSASAEVDIAAWDLRRGRLSVTGMDGAALAAVIPGNPVIDGQFDLDAEVAGEAAAVWSATLTGSQQTGIKLPAAIGGTIGIVGKPVLSVRASRTRGSPLVQIDSVSLRGLSAVKVDAVAAKFLRDLAAARKGEDSVTTRIADRFHDGIAASLGEVTLKGLCDLNPAGRNFAGEITVAGGEIGTTPDASRAARVSGVSLKAGITISQRAADTRPVVRLSDGVMKADKLLVDASVFSNCSATFAVWEGALTAPVLAFDFDDGTFRGEAALTTGGSLDRLRLKFTNVNQALVSPALFPQRFTADGHTGGTLELQRGTDGGFTGAVHLSADTDGKLSFSSEAADDLASVAKATAADIAADGATLPANFPQIVSWQLAHYAYTSGRATATDTDHGLEVSLDYARSPLKPSDAGYGAQVTMGGRATTTNIALNLKDTLPAMADHSVAEILGRAFGIADFLSAAPAGDVSGAATRPTSKPDAADNSGA